MAQPVAPAKTAMSATVLPLLVICQRSSTVVPCRWLPADPLCGETEMFELLQPSTHADAGVAGTTKANAVKVAANATATRFCMGTSLDAAKPHSQGNPRAPSINIVTYKYCDID